MGNPAIRVYIFWNAVLAQRVGRINWLPYQYVTGTPASLANDLSGFSEFSFQMLAFICWAYGAFCRDRVVDHLAIYGRIDWILFPFDGDRAFWVALGAVHLLFYVG